MKVCVTGGLGYLGSRLTEELVNRGFDVSVIDSKIYGNFLPPSVSQKTHIIYTDIRNLSLDGIRAIKSSDVVIHLAAIVGEPACNLIKEKAVDINLNGTKKVVKICEKFKKKMIYASTCSVYGANNRLLKEKSKILPLSIYALTKYAGENLLKESKVQYTIFRMGTLFGFSPRMRFDLVVNTFVAKARIEGKITVFGGQQWRPFLHLKDACDFYIKCIEKDIFHNKLFNLGGINIKIIDLAKKVAKVMKCKIDVIKEIKDPRNYRVDSSLAIKTFGLRFRKNIQVGVKEIKKMLEEGVIKDPNSPIYSNVEYLRKVEEKI